MNSINAGLACEKKYYVSFNSGLMLAEPLLMYCYSWDQDNIDNTLVKFSRCSSS
jgi:hypothetical protein